MKVEWAILLAVILVGFFAAISQVLADDWRSDFKTPDGVNCCGIRDCRPLARGIWIKIGDKIIVFPGREPTEITVIHPSQDGRIWVCTTGCAFQPGVS